VGLALALFIGCSNSIQSAAVKPPDDDWWFGVAMLEPDGTIVVQVRSEENAKPVAEGRYRYPVDDSHYADIKAHVGQLEVGKWKEIRRGKIES